MKKADDKERGGGPIGGMNNSPKKDEGMSKSAKIFFAIVGAVVLAIIIAALV